MVMLDLPLSAEASARLSATNTTSASLIQPLSQPPNPSPSTSLSQPLSTSLSLPLNTQTWHVAVTRAGMFPMLEARCPCEKAPCGLVIPRPDVECDVHHAYASLHQAHSAQDCRSMRSSGRNNSRGAKRASKRAGDGRASNRPGRAGLIDGLLRR